MILTSVTQAGSAWTPPVGWSQGKPVRANARRAILTGSRLYWFLRNGGIFAIRFDAKAKLLQRRGSTSKSLFSIKTPSNAAFSECLAAPCPSHHHLSKINITCCTTRSGGTEMWTAGPALACSPLARRPRLSLVAIVCRAPTLPYSRRRRRPSPYRSRDPRLSQQKSYLSLSWLHKLLALKLDAIVRWIHQGWIRLSVLSTFNVCRWVIFKDSLQVRDWVRCCHQWMSHAGRNSQDLRHAISIQQLHQLCAHQLGQNPVILAYSPFKFFQRGYKSESQMQIFK